MYMDKNSEEDEKQQMLDISEGENYQSEQSYRQMKGEKQEEEKYEEEKQEEEKQEEEKQEEEKQKEEEKEEVESIDGDDKLPINQELEQLIQKEEETQKSKLTLKRSKEQEQLKHSLIKEEPVLKILNPKKSTIEIKSQKSIENEIPLEKEDQLISEDRKDILGLLDLEIQICKERLVQREEKRKQKIEEFIQSEANQKRHREWLRYYDLRGKQYSYHLPDPDSLLCWESLPTHKKYVYCINLLPNLGKEKKPQFKKWTGEPFEVEDFKFFKFDIVVRFWFLCVTYTLKKHVGRDENGKYWDGMPYLYARKLLFNNITIGFSPWNYYYHSENYVADLWSDVNNFSFTLFRKGKRPFGFDEHVRDHKDLKREAIEDVDFIENYGEDQYNKFESEIRSEKELKAFKEIQYKTAKLVPTRREGGDFTADPPRITKKQMELRCSKQKSIPKNYNFTDFNKLSQYIYQKEKINFEKKVFESILIQTVENANKQKIDEAFESLPIQNQEAENTFENANKQKIDEAFESLPIQNQEAENANKKQTDEAQQAYYNMVIERKKRYKQKHFQSDLIVEQLGQFEFQIDWKPQQPLTKIGAYLPSYTIPNYHQEFLAKQQESMSRLVSEKDLRKFSIYYRELQIREEKWPQKPRFQVPYLDWVKDYKSMCRFHLYQHQYKSEIDDKPTLAPKETFYKFGRIAFDRYYIEVRSPWTMLTAFGMGLASIKHFFIIDGLYGS